MISASRDVREIAVWVEPDRHRHPARRPVGAAIGRACSRALPKYAGFPDERWLELSHFNRFERRLRLRFTMCARKDFDAVEPDNIAGWEPENKAGFHMTRADQLRFNRWIANQVHGRGIAMALKNDGRQAKHLVHRYDFAIVEECFQSHVCGDYRQFVRHGKAVVEAEYEQQSKR